VTLPQPRIVARPQPDRRTLLHATDAISATVLAGCHHHRHLPAFQLGRLFDLRQRVQLVLHAHQHVHAQILVHHLAAAEAHGDLHLVAFIEEAGRRTHFDVIVMVIDIGTEFYLLHLDDLLLHAGFVLLFLLLVFELAEVQQLADRWIGVGRNFDKVEARIFRRGHRFSRGHDPDHLTIDTDQTYLRHVYLVIHARTV